MRFIRVLAFVFVVAAVLAATAAAFRFTDASYFTPEGEAGEPYYHKFEMAGGTPPPTFTIINGSLPPGLTLSSDGVVSGVPLVGGSFSFWVNARDNYTPAPMNAQREFTIRIASRLQVTTEAVPAGTVGVPYGVPVTAAGGGTQVWSLASGAPPPGVTFDPVTHTLSGTPTTAGDFSFVVLVKDDKRSDTKALTLSVRQPLAITDPEFGPSEVGAQFSAEIEVTGGINVVDRTALLARTQAGSRAAYTLSVTGLPPGLQFDPAGVIEGIPTAAGTFNVTINASDNEGRTATAAARLTVAPKLALATKRLAATKTGVLYRATLKTRGGVTPLTWGKLAGRLPIGIRFDRKTGVFSGTAKKPGTYRVSVKVTDALKVVSEQALTLTVKGTAKAKRVSKGTVQS
ncbi:MAG TPA: Ig domain-containing protein [Gaiella sp.]|jgi:hypothetical protein